MDGGIFTCGGGVGATDMMLEMIEADYGRPFADRILSPRDLVQFLSELRLWLDLWEQLLL